MVHYESLANCHPPLVCLGHQRRHHLMLRFQDLLSISGNIEGDERPNVKPFLSLSFCATPRHSPAKTHH